MVRELPGSRDCPQRRQLTLAFHLVRCGPNKKLAAAAFADQVVDFRNQLIRNHDVGTAVVGAVLAGGKRGCYDSFPEAQARMTALNPVSYEPDPARHEIYNELYRLYRQLHDAFGGLSNPIDLRHVMKDLIQLKRKASS